MIDSEVAKNVAAIGGAVLSLFAGKIGAVGKAVDAVAKTTQKLSWMKPLIDLAGIKNPGKKSATWIVTTVTKSVLGTPPTPWVEVTKTDGK